VRGKIRMRQEGSKVGKYEGRKEVRREKEERGFCPSSQSSKMT
jgi:hypothetical protein